MKYAQSTETAIDSIFFMAAHPERQDFSVEEIAAAQKVSSSYLAKIFQQLAKAGLLRSHRGAKGGYQIGRSTREITLWDIALVFEGSSPMYECNATAKSCALGPKCLIVNTFREAEKRMQEVLQGVSIEDLVKKVKENGGHPAWVGVSEAQPAPVAVAKD